MIWKNLKKLIIPNIRRNGPTKQAQEKWVAFGNQLALLGKELRDLRAYTGNEKGKVGELYSIWTGSRKFSKNNKKWTFRKFNQGPFYSPHAFIKALQKRGFKILGEGAFATVLAKDGQDRVIKVIRRPDGWINYVHWAAQIGEAGHFAPKVFSYKKIKGKRKDFEVAVMERLSYTLEDAPQEHEKKILPGLIYRAADNDMARKFTEVLAPGLLDFLAKMALKYEIPIKNFDLHSGNLMIRGDGSFVVVDPVSRSRGDEYIRLRAGDFSPAVALSLLLMTGFLIESNYRYRSQWAN